MPDFPENDVQVFRTYSAASIIAESGPAIVKSLRSASHLHVGQSIKPPLVKEIDAARKSLLAFLSHDALSALQILDGAQVMAPGADGIGVYERIEQGEFRQALVQLNAVSGIVPRALTPQVIDLALTPDPVNFEFLPIRGGGHSSSGGQGGLVPAQAVLPGYAGPALNPKQRRRIAEYSQLFVEGVERRFWLDTLRAECFLGLRSGGDLNSALGLYQGLLAGSALDEVRRKFVALRASAAMLMLGDMLFRSNRRLPAEQRRRAKRIYTTAADFLTTEGVTPDNPLAAQVIARASGQLAKLGAGLNFLGFRDSLVPVQRVQTLEQQARQDVDRARAAVTRAMEFRSLANKAEEQDAALRQEKADAERTVEIAALRSQTARDRVKNVDLQARALSDQQEWFSSRTLSEVSNAVVQGAAQGALALVAPGTTATGAAGTGGIGIAAGLGSVLFGKLARSEELRLQQEAAEVDRRIAQREVKIALLEEQTAVARHAFISNSIVVSENRVLNQDLFYTLARMYEDLGRNYLETAIREAFLFERAVAFDVRTPDLQVIRLDYENDNTTLFAAPDLLESDVLTVARLLTATEQKRDTFTDRISLRTTFPLEFREFLQTGQLNAAISRYELDKRRPGSSQGRLKEVTVELKGLVPANGITGTLTHTGRFLLRDAKSTLDPATVRFLPTVETVNAALTAQENGDTATATVGGIAVFDFGRDQVELDGSGSGNEEDEPFLLNLTEGYGPAALWTLAIPETVARNLTDVVLQLTTNAFESTLVLADKVRRLIAEYEKELGQETGHDLDRFVTLSLRTSAPAVFQSLASKAGDFDIPADFVKADARAKAVLFQALDATGAAVPGVGIAAGKPDGTFTLERTTGPTGFTEDLTVPLNIIAAQQQPLAGGTWNIRLADTAQFSQIKDLILLILFDDRNNLDGRP